MICVTSGGRVIKSCQFFTSPRSVLVCTVLVLPVGVQKTRTVSTAISRITTGQPNAGVAYELDAIAAAVIGGTSLSGGVGSIGGTLLGALLMGVINNGLDLLNVSSYYQQIIKGLIIIGAVWLDRRQRN